MSAALAGGVPSSLVPALSFTLPPGFVASLGWALLHFVWQGALIGCATAVLLVALRNARPGHRYAVACVALLLCIAWPAADLALALLDGHDVQAVRLLPLAPAPVAMPKSATGWQQLHKTWTSIPELDILIA